MYNRNNHIKGPPESDVEMEDGDDPVNLDENGTTYDRQIEFENFSCVFIIIHFLFMYINCLVLTF